MIININQLKLILPNNSDCEEWLNPLQSILPEYEINTNKRLAAFLSQTAYESNDYTRLEENLNYSAGRLLQVFPRIFSSLKEAEEYEHDPELIANKIYGGRMGNGNEASGDGWKYRGRGLLQTTGKDNYKYISDAFTNVDIVANPDLLATDMTAIIHSACLFWYDHDLNCLADVNSIKSITKIINGSLYTFAERESKYNEILQILF